MKRQREKEKPTPFHRRALKTAEIILEASHLRYQSAQIDGLAVILMAYAEDEIRRCRDEHPTASDVAALAPPEEPK